MAVGFLDFSTKHGVAESTNLKATIVGNIWSIKAAANIDNGCIVGRGNYVAPEYYAEAAASNSFAGKIIEKAANGMWRVLVTAAADTDGLVLSVPLIYEEYTTRMQEESNFFNLKDDLLRVYQLVPGDVFSVSAECFTTTPTNASIGKAVSVSSKKLAIAN